MKDRIGWDDLRVVREIARSAGLSGAAQALGVSHATMYRRLGAIEEQFGVRLFVRERSGYRATLAGEEAVAAAEEIADSVSKVERRLAGQDLRPSGTVRMTTTDTLMAGILPQMLAEFQSGFPDISVEVTVSNDVINLSRYEVDLALRPSTNPPENLLGRRIAKIAMAVFGPANEGRGESGFDPGSRKWVGASARMDYRQLDRWMDAQDVLERCICKTDSLLGMAYAVRAGIGVAVLPCYIANVVSNLVQLSPPISALTTDLWVLTHPDLRETARVKALSDFLSHAGKRSRPLLEGLEAP